MEEDDEHMHCFVLFYRDEKVYHMEHPNFQKREYMSMLQKMRQSKQS